MKLVTSGYGTSRPVLNVRFPVAIGVEADIRKMGPIADIGRIKIPHCSSLLPYLDVLCFAWALHPITIQNISGWPKDFSASLRQVELQ